MTVFDIVVMSCAFSESGSEVMGDVQFSITDATSKERSITMQCRCPVSKRIRPDALLIGDAIRQLRRMPEIRSGQTALKFAKGLKPLAEAKAA